MDPLGGNSPRRDCLPNVAVGREDSNLHLSSALSALSHMSRNGNGITLIILIELRPLRVQEVRTFTVPEPGMRYMAIASCTWDYHAARFAGMIRYSLSVTRRSFVLLQSAIPVLAGA